jgi:hypothetical protein
MRKNVYQCLVMRTVKDTLLNYPEIGKIIHHAEMTQYFVILRIKLWITTSGENAASC